MILINITMTIRPDKMDEWLAVADAYARDVNSEDGCLFFQFARSLANENEFVCIEGFKDAEAGGAHVQQPGADALPPAGGQDGQGLDLADPLPGLPGVAHPGPGGRHHVGQPVPDHLAARAGQQQHRARPAQQLGVQGAALGPGPRVIDIWRELGHRLGVPVVHADPQRLQQRHVRR